MNKEENNLLKEECALRLRRFLNEMPMDTILVDGVYVSVNLPAEVVSYGQEARSVFKERERGEGCKMGEMRNLKKSH